MVSVIIPTLDEEQTLPRTLTAVSAAAGGSEFEVIVADGGSTDGTVEVARARGCVCLPSPHAQRATQMNLGGAHAKGETLLFLHADTLLPPGALGLVEAACQHPGVSGGGFARRYDSPSPWLALTCWLAEERNRWIGWHLGDQAIFTRKQSFEQLGGFRLMNLFEDVDFSRRLRRLGKLVTLHPPVVSSARRFDARGPFRTSMEDVWATLRYLGREWVGCRRRGHPW